MIYGELNVRESRTIYVHGSIDPWHALGITHTRTNDTISVYINGKFKIIILITSSFLLTTYFIILRNTKKN